ncbi:MAG: peptidylprolyl isomerase, partial [Thermoproteota archaeon]|nr:peptidylprolyl isomerase [Thermoproteota archaeon]
MFFIIINFASGAFSQILFTYGNNAVSKDDFLRAYNKNKTAVTDKSAALKEYLDLYIKFKLKVKAAQDMRLDTMASLAPDLQNFRTQIEESYLNDESQVIALAQEAFIRSQKDIHVVYWLIPFKNPADTVSAFNTAIDLYKYFSGEIKENLPKSATSISDADIGFITVFTLPYKFENVVYNLKPGEFSKPYYSKTGYYIFKNVRERKAVGKLKAQQILVALPEGANDEDNAKAKKLADSLFVLIQSGSDFGDLAKQYSNDKMTYLSGGILPEFGVGKYDSVFESNVFELQKDGEISRPFQTQFGYHIVKRISKIEVTPDKNNDTYMYALKQQVLHDARITSAKEKFINDVLKRLNYKKNTSIKDEVLYQMSDSFVVAHKKLSMPGINEKTILFSLNNETVRINDWLKYLQEYKSSEQNKGETNKELMNKFISTTALDYYRKKLSDYNPDFKYQLQEFKDGNMLFEVMERNVWTKASNDTMGLKKFYNEHQNKYTWNESADAVLISCANEKIAKDAVDQIAKGKSWSRVADESNSQIQTDSGRYELTQIPAKQSIKLMEGMVTEP